MLTPKDERQGPHLRSTGNYVQQTRIFRCPHAPTSTVRPPETAALVGLGFQSKLLSFRLAGAMAWLNKI